MFILSKLIIAFIAPLGTSLVAGLAALGLAGLGKSRLAILTGALALCWLWAWSLPVSSSWLMGKLEARYASVDIQALPDVDALVVLGGGVSPPARRSDFPDLESGADRIWHAARIYHAGKAPLLVLSGGTPSVTSDSEAQAMRAFLLDLGVPDASLLLEESSLNTNQNARNTAKLLRDREISRIILVTSAYHMGRARALFESEGLSVIAAATDYRGRSMSGWRQWVPTTEALDDSSKAIKEIVGRVAGR